MERYRFCIVSRDSPKTLSKTVFLQNIHTRKLVEITVFIAVYSQVGGPNHVQIWYLKKATSNKIKVLKSKNSINNNNIDNDNQISWYLYIAVAFCPNGCNKCFLLILTHEPILRLCSKIWTFFFNPLSASADLI